ncbi:MAG TPA: hypothetical protein VEP67_03950 [Thiobacillaceae bacterium]|nr:hypothetical protein [Thiobacillaceae bacterium]
MLISVRISEAVGFAMEAIAWLGDWQFANLYLINPDLLKKDAMNLLALRSLARGHADVD